MRRAKADKASSGERAREILALLAELAGGAALAPDGAGAYVLAQPEGDTLAAAAPQQAPSAELIAACLAQDWLEWERGRLVLSHTGRAFFRRQGAGHDDAFRAQHQLRVRAEREIGGARRELLLNEAESPLGWLKSRKDRNGRPLLSAEQVEAGERLSADYWFAAMSPRVTANWSALAPRARLRRGAPSAASLRDEVIAAKERVMRALDAVGPELGGILVDICCELKGLEEAETANGWPQRAGKVVLQIALTRLARHYGLIAEARGGRRGLRHWGSADYRPTLDAWRSAGGDSCES
ncbi:DUF6456 domain-containing protein [Methyloceanibacter sp.]|uniref:DUF6456 domain-containing protein n=1 Tax=Methyloceanibacter sp. TaxID=1965321 RepID=UPI002D3238B0|nr:DUF6456 domain-containing protein [Methyloceanibacter sp.]HZP10441.1 DUF6456 domain-containing protein [Methyloceanibacter sp.]